MAATRGSAEPQPRNDHFSTTVGGEFYIYGGPAKDFSKGGKRELPLHVHSFNQCTETWQTREAIGDYPLPGLHKGVCASLGHHIYLYGGSNEFGSHCGLQDSFYSLDTVSLEWSRLPNGPMKKIGGGMVAYEDKLILFGGYGIPSEIQPGATFVESSSFPGRGWTNELHIFDLRSGKWSSPTVTGTRPPPLTYFSLTKVDGHRAVLFGGYGGPSVGRCNHVYILDMEKMHWSALDRVEGPCPVGRSNHAAVCLWNGGKDHHQLLITGGWDDNGDIYKVHSDAWIVDLQTGRWREVDVPGVHARYRHSAAAFCISPGVMEVTLFGGYPKWLGDPLASTVVLRFGSIVINSCTTEGLHFCEYSLAPMNDSNAPTRKWIFTDLADCNRLGTNQRIKEKAAKMVQSVPPELQRKQDMLNQETEERAKEAERRCRAAENELEGFKGKIEEAEDRVQKAEKRCRAAENELDIYKEKLEEVERRVKETMASLNQRVQAAEERAHAAERKLREAMEDCNKRVEKSEKRADTAEKAVTDLERKLLEAENNRELCRESLRETKQELQQREVHWVVDRREIQLTREEVGKGSWATISVATFRGSRVAAKTILHTSSYNVSLFEREMNMAARIRHPNLLQFIGATQSEELIILTELMPTSLQKELENRQRLRSTMPLNQVIVISLDVARALNYLHLMQPHPLIHRDISSANVLLQPLSSANKCWKAKVSDYGTVNLFESLNTECPGNLTYSAPEANDPTKQSPKMDIFSFGVLLLEMLAGEFPDRDRRARQLLKITDSNHPLQPLVQKCMRRERDKRPSASSVIEELDTVVSLEYVHD